ncbi:DUF2339 domain-containing protein [Kaistella sp. G5-32]|uniref:DUF2339 domain-containing protein n=1 Tax=Kaistella gelatinilytica TaxID=2787636 RepID=A0ABS0F8R7_9FLAO|nr:DUF2339 domain-containing protein [Kaistella gelatinilytica]MBF8456100.1 DUF2339 domain-containing protein [Kaistella gelatinilytica]
MDFLNPLALVSVILLIIILRKINSSRSISEINLKKLEDKLDRLQKKMEELTVSGVNVTNVSTESPKEEIIKAPEIIVRTVPLHEEEIIEEEIEEPETEFDSEMPLTEEEFEFEHPQDTRIVAFSNDPVASPVSNIIQEPKIPKKSLLEKFKEENPDIEKFIGENLINKIGILILVLGISFFVKYAIDKNWINEPARVGIGVLAGALVMGIAHRLKANYKAFSSVFVAGAFAIFYFTIAIAFQEYHLFSQSVAFAIMIVITILSSFISVSYNRQELGVLSLIAGFAVPWMVSTGEGNYMVLLTYIAILNIGMLIISYYKKWNIVTILAFVFTCLLFSIWWNQAINLPNVPHRGALFFATLFYLIFSVATVLNNLRSSGTFSKIQYFLIVANTFFFFGMGLAIITDWNIPFKGLFTVVLGVYNLVFASILYKRFGLNRNAVYLLLGLTLTFATLTIPIQFKGNYITLFWACEAALLFWLAQKSKIEVFKWSAVIVQALMLVSLMMDWEHSYSVFKDSGEIIRPVFITGIVAVISLIYTSYLMRNETEKKTFYGITFDPKFYGMIAFSLSIIVGYFTGIFETVYQAKLYNESSATVISYGAAFHFTFSAVLIYFIFKGKSHFLKQGATVLGIANLLILMFAFMNLPTADLHDGPLKMSKNISAYLLHFVLLASVIFSLYVIIKNSLITPVLGLLKLKWALWIFVIVGVTILSQEMIVQVMFYNSANIIPDTIASITKMNVNSEAYNSMTEKYFTGIYNLETQIVKVGFPVLWGIISFGLLIVGIKRGWKQLRIIALVLLGVTVVKLFTYDINDASETGKIIAFILLGVLILIISFVYQKLKKLVSDEPKIVEEEKEDESI